VEVVVPAAPADAGLTDDHRSRTRPRLILAAALALVSLVCAGILVWLLVDGPGDSEVQDQREQVMSLTDQFVKRLGAYGPDQLDESGQMPQYREQVTEVISDKFATDFEKQVKTVEQLVAQAGVERSSEVFATGVSSIDEDSARVLVAGAFHDTYTPATAGKKKPRTVEQEPLPFRFTVDLVKVDDEWKVDDFTPAGGTQGGGTAPQAPAPSAPGGDQ
jgi:hypothetical protein